MLIFLLRRLWSTLTVVVGVAAVIFVLLHLSGDPVALLVPADAPPEVMQDTRHALGLDRPLPQQFVIYLSHAVTGDLGTSLRAQPPRHPAHRRAAAPHHAPDGGRAGAGRG